MRGTVDLADLDFEHINTREVDLGPVFGLGSVVEFGKGCQLTVEARSPEQLDAFAEVFLVAASHLRMARGGPSDSETEQQWLREQDAQRQSDLADEEHRAQNDGILDGRVA